MNEILKIQFLIFINVECSSLLQLSVKENKGFIIYDECDNINYNFYIASCRQISVHSSVLHQSIQQLLRNVVYCFQISSP